uniref:Partner of Y14 and mago n=1 Tax=Plectus sambesii TaxID=2011161 RepID=A0A914XRK0_9BILA
MADTGGDHRILTKAGETFIPASQRPDGSWRKERRVKTGYIPQEEQPKYESKGRQMAREMPTYPIGLAPDQLAEHVAALGRNQKTTMKSIPGLSAESIDAARASASQSSSSGSKKKRGKGQATPASFTMESPAAAPKKPVAAVASANAAITPEDHITKKIRNLQKKLADIDALQERIDSGQLKQPEKTQLDKIQRRPEIQSEIDSLQNELEQLTV